MSEYLIDHIDAPIRKAVAGLNLLGFKTYMSCCGFSYDYEEVQKSHLNKAYIYLDFEQIAKSEKLCSLLTYLCLESGWKINRVATKFVDFYADTWTPGHPWAAGSSVHNYEIFVLAIAHLVKAIDKIKFDFVDSVEIKDGNEFYMEISKFWKYTPKKSWTVNAKDWHEMIS